MKDVICLDPSQVKEASTLLCRAFYHDPLVQYIVPDEARRAHVLPSFYRLVVRYALRYGEISTTPEVEGVACWLTPGNTTVSTWRLLRVAPTAPFSFSLSEQRRNTIYARYTDEAHERAISRPHWYLWGLGVEPSRQHQGLGGQLIQPMLARADRAGLPCYLETTNEANVPFYEKHGFTVVSDGVVPGTALRVWGMRRG
jgi:ribosomal protein S18 acetylase RimI-like enzyme